MPANDAEISMPAHRWLPVEASLRTKRDTLLLAGFKSGVGNGIVIENGVGWVVPVHPFGRAFTAEPNNGTQDHDQARFRDAVF